MASTDIYRIDHHGSLIRPFAPSDPSAPTDASDEHASRADEAIRDVVRLQRRLLLTTVTDGQFRRSDLRDPLLIGATGFEPTGAVEHGGLRQWRNTGRVEPREPTAAREVEVPRQTTSIPVKVTLPSPAYIASHTWLDGAGSPYGSAAELGFALAEVVRGQIEALAAAGVTYIQLDNPDYALHYIDADTGVPRPHLDVLDAIAVDRAALEDRERFDAVTFALSLDRGEFVTDSVDEQVAWEVFGELPFDRFLIPYYAEDFVDQNLLQFIPDDRQAVLGVVNAASPQLEDVDRILARIDRALAIFDSAHVALSPSKGFQDAAYLPAAVSSDEQNRLLTHVETVARMAWGAEL